MGFIKRVLEWVAAKGPALPRYELGYRFHHPTLGTVMVTKREVGSKTFLYQIGSEGNWISERQINDLVALEERL